MSLRKKGLGRIKIAKELERQGKSCLLGAYQRWIYTTAKPFQHSLVTQLKEGHEELTIDKAYLIGVLCGDGFVTTRNRVGLSVTDFDFLKKFIDCLNSVYGLEVGFTLKFNNNCNFTLKKPPKIVFESVAVSKNLYLDLMRYTSSYHTHKWVVPPQILEAPKQIKSAFLRGLFDSEGTVRLKSKGRAMLQFASGNLSSLLIVKELMFKEYGIAFWQGYNNNEVPVLRVERYKDIKSYADCIGFSMERKQKLLEYALASYKRKGIRKYSKEFKLQALALYDAGYSTYEVGKLLDFQYTNLYDFIKQRALGNI